MPTLIQLAKYEAEQLDKIQRYVCSEKCRFYESVRSAYPDTNSPCDTCRLNVFVARKLEDAGLLNVVHKGVGEIDGT